MLDYTIKLKNEARKVKNKVLEYERQMHAHNGSGFETGIILNNLTCERRIVNSIKAATAIFF